LDPEQKVDDLVYCTLNRIIVNRFKASMCSDTVRYRSVILLRTQFERVLTLACENQLLAAVERNLLLKMAHIEQGYCDAIEIAKLIRKGRRADFHRYVGPALKLRSQRYRKRALVITYSLIGAPPSLIAQFLGLSEHAIREFVSRFKSRDAPELFRRPPKSTRTADREDLKARLFAIMHAPPIDYDVNRTTWTIRLLREQLAKEGFKVGETITSEIIRAAGYNFRKTREVLTSNDPDYRVKLKRITRILRRLGPNDRFFSVDEYGPFSVRQHGGRRRVRRGEYPTIPQYQSSKGRIIITAALELSRNQITHFYSGKKDTQEMIALLQRLLKEYTGYRRIYFSWDAASWHSSKRFLSEVRRINSPQYRKLNNTPVVKLAPLPARAQFLNVIESVFSGMSRSIIQNSDYESVAAAKAAIDRYFRERNEHFLRNPKRAGNKIWGKELVKSKFSESNNCRDPRFVRLASAGH
jgi:transposase